MTDFSSRLTPLQRELLCAFAVAEPDFVLSGGAALVGFYLQHRGTRDLDFFCADTDRDLEQTGRTLEALATDLGCTLELLEGHPRFRRYRVVRQDASTVVDLVLDSTPRIEPPEQFGDILVDTKAEIAANKLCTLTGRAEIRDLVDLVALLDAGIRLEDALAAAEIKQGGVDAATLAWLLDEMRIGEDTLISGPLSPSELEHRRIDLVKALRKLAFPG